VARLVIVAGDDDLKSVFLAAELWHLLIVLR
jgi:hypothetical protein